MAFSIGGIGKGIQKGLQYDVQWGRNLAWAIKTANQNALAACLHIIDVHEHEILGTAAEVTESHAVSLMFTDDPFKGSRQLMHDFENMFGKH